jgi:hypothetical protein
MSCDRTFSTQVFLVFLSLRANTEITPNIASCYCMLLAQPSRFKFIKSSKSRSDYFHFYTISIRRVRGQSLGTFNKVMLFQSQAKISPTSPSYILFSYSSTIFYVSLFLTLFFERWGNKVQGIQSKLPHWATMPYDLFLRNLSTR